MIRFFLLLSVLSATTIAIDKTVFKNCSRVEFCTKYRNFEPNEKDKYSADLKSLTIDDKTNVVKVPLKNDNGDTLNLLITLLEGNKVRTQIQEPSTTRFDLSDIILVEDLKSLPVKKSSIGPNNVYIQPIDTSNNQRVYIEAGPPFVITFTSDKEKRVVLDGNNFVMEHTSKSQVFTFKVSFPQADRLYGLHDHAYKMNLGTTNNGSANTMDPFRFRNSDAWGYEANSPMALYGSRPVVIGYKPEKTSAIFLLNAAEQWIDVASDIDNPYAYFIVEKGAFDLFTLLGPTPKDFVRQFTGLTGRAHLPQIWALGYHQCRFSYKSQDDVKTVVALMGQNDFPFDVIYLDGDHTDDYRWFHWNHTTYTDPIEMFNNISAAGRLAVSISDPHIKVEDTYDVYIGAKEKYFTKWANGSNYEADCWPGKSSWIDYMIPEASDYYASWYSYKKFNGSTPTLAGIWNDMNEPAVFDETIEKTMPWEVLHMGKVPHGEIHNIYGFTHVRSTHKGLMDRDNGLKRPFILTRSHFAGSQRYAAMWTGDNSATWEHFANTYSECMNANMMGMVFCGADIGGFIGDPSDELLQRWYQGAMWLPFFRGHSSREAKRREPYLFSKEVQAVLRKALKTRYQHIPSFYTLFFEHTRTGDPIIRPLYYDYPEVYDADTQVLVGTDIMGVAITKPGVNQTEVVLPGANQWWYRADREFIDPLLGDGKLTIDVDINSSPFFYRAGSIIFRKDRPRDTAVAAINDSYTVYVNCDQSQNAAGRLYIDDYFSFDYANKDNYLYINATYDNVEKTLTLESIDGDSTGLDAVFEQVVINKVNFTEGVYKTQQDVFTKSYDGIPLSEISIGSALRKNNKYTMKLM
ncbi:unnamed protein product [Phyllotreta striolata]|uniref:Glucosidase II subunit alpha n=1 Tax=Phyllotreta striolata TaxID=444603 RepID=A0A9P0DLN4_PHYSR|nr:unnamed protein product [Phyllotreta striolata]